MLRTDSEREGSRLILPTLLSWQQSVFVTDLKGELYELTSGWRQKYANNRNPGLRSLSSSAFALKSQVLRQKPNFRQG